jgi:hypothetical protein
VEDREGVGEDIALKVARQGEQSLGQ